MKINRDLEHWVRQSQAGDKAALEQVIIEIQDMIFNLAVRMLWSPDLAKDATQEILIRLVINIGSFKGASSFRTWAYRLASNSLINYRHKQQKQRMNFEAYAKDLRVGLVDTIAYTSNSAERKLLIAEAKIGCSNAMLQCLDAESRMVYILGEILEMSSPEGALILEVTPANYRKKLSRARKRLHQFLQSNCGIINPMATCRCYKKVDDAIERGRIDPKATKFVNAGQAEGLVRAIEGIKTEVALYQTNPEYSSPKNLLETLYRALEKES